MQRLVLLFVVLALSALAICQETNTIIQKSVAANKRDFSAAPGFDWGERDYKNGGSKTYEEIMVFGSPYERLVAVNAKPLNTARQAEEEQKLDHVISERRNESSDKRAQRIATYQTSRRRDQFMMDELVKAFDFKLLGEQKLDQFNVYVLQATPRPGYNPPTMETKALTGMQGKLWIDEKSFQWVKVEAEVIHPVSMEGFLAKVEPGTRFELEKEPVENDVWLPTHFAMRSRAKVLFLFHHRGQEEERYFNYHKSHDYGKPTN